MQRTSRVAALFSTALFITTALSPARAQYSTPGATSALDAVTSLGANRPPALGSPGSSSAALLGCTGEYRAVAVCALKQILKGYTLAGAEISPLKGTRGPQLGDGMTCVRVQGPAGPTYFAVFLEGGKYLDARRAVGIDACQSESYAPAPLPVVEPAVAANGRKARKTVVVPR